MIWSVRSYMTYDSSGPVKRWEAYIDYQIDDPHPEQETGHAIGWDFKDYRKAKRALNQERAKARKYSRLSHDDEIPF